MSAIVFTRPIRSAARAADRVPRWARLETPAPARRHRTSPAVYRRRRLAAVLLLVAAAFVAGVVLAIALLPSPAGGALTDEARRAQQVRYVIQPGDTLWRAAGSLAPDEDPRQVVDALSAARGTSEVRVGEVLVWPID